MHFVEDSVGELALEAADGEELQVDDAAAPIDVAEMSNAAADFRGYPQLLIELAPESLLGALADFNFAPRELPLQSHGLILPALANQNLVFAQDERCDDQPDRREGLRCPFGLGFSLHFLSILDVAAAESRSSGVA